MGKPLSDLLDPQDVANAAGVSRKTVLRRYKSSDEVVVVGGRAYVRRLGLRKAMGGLYRPEFEDIPAAADASASAESVSATSLAASVGATYGDIRRAMARCGAGEVLGGRWVVRKDDVDAVKAELKRKLEMTSVVKAAEMWGVGDDAVRNAAKRLGVGEVIEGHWMIPANFLDAVRAAVARTGESLKTPSGREKHAKALEIAARSAGIRPAD